MNATTILRRAVASCAAAAFLATLAPALAAGLPNPFFAMDTGTRDAVRATPEAQARLLKELGFAGIGWSPGQIPQMLAALDRDGLKLFTVYLGVDLGDTNRHAPAGIVKVLEQVKGRDVMLWLYVLDKKHGRSDEAGDEAAVAVIGDIADKAKAAGARVALYPHTGFWLERVQDAVRVAKKVNRDNVGVTFNLCHCLKVGDERKIPDLLELARPHLFAVTINGADHAGNWDRLIQTLDRGEFDVLPVLKKLKALGYAGPIGLQHYGIKGDAYENLKRSLTAWRQLSAAAAP
jgi:sugar phosphate isomerase/epimerase